MTMTALTKDSTATCPHGYTVCLNCLKIAHDGSEYDLHMCQCKKPKLESWRCGKTMTTYWNEERQRWEWNHFH